MSIFTNQTAPATCKVVGRSNNTSARVSVATSEGEKTMASNRLMAALCVAFIVILSIGGVACKGDPKRVGPECDTATVCESGVCNFTTGTCVQCLDDSHCPPANVCESYVCVPVILPTCPEGFTGQVNGACSDDISTCTAPTATPEPTSTATPTGTPEPECVPRDCFGTTGVCNASGKCEFVVADDGTECHSNGLVGACDLGDCIVACQDDTACDDGNACTLDHCEPGDPVDGGVPSGFCVNDAVTDFAGCTFVDGESMTPGVCDMVSGSCVKDGCTGEIMARACSHIVVPACHLLTCIVPQGETLGACSTETVVGNGVACELPDSGEGTCTDGICTPPVLQCTPENVATACVDMFGDCHIAQCTDNTCQRVRRATGFDCSGFAQYVYAQHGVNLPHYSGYQAQMGMPVDPKDIQPG